MIPVCAITTAGLLTKDPRRRERKKYGQEGARRKFTWWVLWQTNLNRVTTSSSLWKVGQTPSPCSQTNCNRCEVLSRHSGLELNVKHVAWTLTKYADVFNISALIDFTECRVLEAVQSLEL